MVYQLIWVKLRCSEKCPQPQGFITTKIYFLLTCVVLAACLPYLGTEGCEINNILGLHGLMVEGEKKNIMKPVKGSSRILELWHFCLYTIGQASHKPEADILRTGRYNSPREWDLK